MEIILKLCSQKDVKVAAYWKLTVTEILEGLQEGTQYSVLSTHLSLISLDELVLVTQLVGVHA